MLTSSYYVFLGHFLIFWHVKKQPTVAHSSTKVEYHFVALYVVEIIWICCLLWELGVTLTVLPIVFCDNVSTTYFAASPNFHACTKAC